MLGLQRLRVNPGDTDVLGGMAGIKRVDGSQMAFQISATDNNGVGTGRGPGVVTDRQCAQGHVLGSDIGQRPKRRQQALGYGERSFRGEGRPVLRP